MQCQEYQIYCSGTFQLYVVGSNDFEERHAVSAQTSFIRARACPFLNPAFNETCFQRPPESVVYEINKQAPTITKDSKPGNFITERTTKTKFMGVVVDVQSCGTVAKLASAVGVVWVPQFSIIDLNGNLLYGRSAIFSLDYNQKTQSRASEVALGDFLAT